MPIITQLNATKLRSLKYGNDTSDGGNSGQPYIKTELKDLDKPLTRVRLTKFDDGLIRGGAIGALNASIVDTIRIGKFFKDLPKGPLFLAKQVGLQLSNPKLETKKGLGGLLGSTRLYNLGINTLLQIPLTAFGGHLTRHGLSPVTDDSIKYIKVVAENNKIADDNRLVALTNKFNLGDNVGGAGEEFDLQEARRENRAANREGRQANREDNRFNRRLNRFGNRQERQFVRSENRRLRQWSKEFNADNFVRSDFIRSKFTRNNFKRNKLDVKSLLERFTIDSYNGGPNSLYGIGRTIINRYSFTEDKEKIDDALFQSEFQTTVGSLSVDPLKEPSRFEKADGDWDTGSISSPLSPLSPLRKIGENNQFDALARRPQTLFFYGTGVSTSKLQGDIRDGNINVVEGVKATPAKTILRDALSDKFIVLKNQKEDTDYIGGLREILGESQSTETNSTDLTGDFTQGSRTVSVRSEQEAAEYLASSTFLNNSTLDTSVVAGKKFGVSKTVKASIVDVSKMEGGLEATYKGGDMVAPPFTDITQVTSGGQSFSTEEVKPLNREIDKTNSNFYYLGGAKTVLNFNRIDRNIMLVTFDPINPFDTTDLGTVVFSAYLSGFKYNSNSTWNPVKYVGRSESFYTFTEHKRDVSFNIQVPCFNRIHLLEKHRALSQLQSAGAGKYDGNNRLGGIITKVTLGNYLVAEPGILTSVSFDIPDVSSWDIDEKLAMYINAQFSFTIIGKELPTYREGGFLNYLSNPLGGTGFLTGSQAR
jgi:hypothetical protein